MTAISAPSARPRFVRPSFLQSLFSSGRRVPRIRVGDLPESLRRDLGFMDGHITPRRHLFRD